MIRFPFLAVPSVVFLTILAAPTFGQDRFSETIGVTEVVVPVRVLAKGKPLAGLTRDDFELYDRGVRQEIVGFEVRDLTETAAPPGGDGSTRLEDDTQGRRLLVLFDFGFAGRIDLSRSLRGVRTMIGSDLRPVDRVAVATWGPISGVNLLVGFTRDRAKVDLALDAIQAMLDAKNKRQREVLGELHRLRFEAGGGTTYDALVEELGSTAAMALLTGPVVYEEGDGGGVEIREKRAWFAPIRTRVEVDVTEPVAIAQDRVVDDDTSTIRALGLGLAELGSLLRDVGGQKDIMLLSEGFSGPLLRDARSLSFLQESFRSLRDASWTLHAVDVRGLPGPGERSFPSSSLLFMASATGGELVENVNNFSVATSRVLRRTSLVYLLSFQPDPGDDAGRFREINVKVRSARKGVTILHRPGYYAPRATADKESYDQRVDAVEWLLTNLEVSELDVAVFAQTLTDPLGGIRVQVAVDVAGPSFMATTPRTRRLDLRLAVLDRDENVRELLTGEARPGDVAGTRQLGRGGVRFEGHLAIPPGDYHLRLMVMGLPGGEVYLGGHALSVGIDPEEGAEILAAPRERDPESWLLVGTERRSAFFR